VHPLRYIYRLNAWGKVDENRDRILHSLKLRAPSCQSGG
jgi:hypothetical protein